MKRIAIAICFALMMETSGGQARADIADRAIALIERMATIVDENKSSCDTMGDKLNAFFTANAATFKEMKDDAWAAKYKDRLAAAVQKMTAGLQPCMSNPRVMDALKKLQ